MNCLIDDRGDWEKVFNTSKKIVFSLFTKKPKITLLMNTHIKNMLLLSDEIKRSVSGGGAVGERRKSPEDRKEVKGSYLRAPRRGAMI